MKIHYCMFYLYFIILWKEFFKKYLLLSFFADAKAWIAIIIESFNRRDGCKLSCVLIFSFAALIYPRIELSYFSIADALSADIDVAGVVSRTKPLNRSPNVPCRLSECHKCPIATDPPAT